MITDEQRREVAQKLRTLACTPDEIGITEHAVIRNLGISEGSYDDSCRSEDVSAIADLIDRPTCRNIYDEDEDGACANGFQCSACGHAVEDYEGYRVLGTWNYCSNCGAEVVEDD